MGGRCNRGCTPNPQHKPCTREPTRHAHNPLSSSFSSHPTEQGRVLSRVDPERTAPYYHTAGLFIATRMHHPYTHHPPQDKAAVLSRLDPERAAELLALLPPSEAVALLACLADTSTRLVAEALQPQEREALMAVGGNRDGSGGGLVGCRLGRLWLRKRDREVLVALCYAWVRWAGYV